MTTTEKRPTRAGQLVFGTDGLLGITTDSPAKRTPTIGVQFVGMPYPIRAQLDSITLEQIVVVRL